ncbi:MAG: hypothetical protein ACD_79C01364G0004, partial [uncultured bacterium]
MKLIRLITYQILLIICLSLQIYSNPVMLPVYMQKPHIGEICRDTVYSDEGLVTEFSSSTE